MSDKVKPLKLKGSKTQKVSIFLFSYHDGQLEKVYELDPDEIQNLYSALAQGSLFLPFGDTWHNMDDILKFKIHKKLS